MMTLSIVACDNKDSSTTDVKQADEAVTTDSASENIVNEAEATDPAATTDGASTEELTSTDGVTGEALNDAETLTTQATSETADVPAEVAESTESGTEEK